MILISVDTLRADHLGCYGYSRDTSPFIDSLAARGVLFENAIVQLPGTLESHMSILTGLYPAEHGVQAPDGMLSERIPILPEILSGAGFRCAGSTEGGYVSGRYGFRRGFEVFNDHSTKLPTAVESTFWRGLEFLRSLEDDDRFFLFMHTYAVHDPYYPPLPYTTRYLDSTPNVNGVDPESFAAYRFDELRPVTEEILESNIDKYRATWAVLNAILPRGALLPNGPNLAKISKRGRSGLPESTLELYTALYDASIRYTDDVLRALFGSLEKERLLDSTLVILTADHGEEFLEHGMMAHNQVYHECLHVPLIVLNPGVRTPARVSGLVRSVDIAPTVLELTGVSSEQYGLSGASFARRLREPDSPGPEDAYASTAQTESEAAYGLGPSDELFQLVLHRQGSPTEDLAIGARFAFQSVSSELRFQAASFHRSRTMTVAADGVPLAQLELNLGFRNVVLELPTTGASTTITLSVDSCDVPRDLGLNEDTRCLSAYLRGLEDEQELFDLSADPRAERNLLRERPGMAEALTQRIARNRRTARADTPTAPLDSETEERLRELGYIE